MKTPTETHSTQKASARAARQPACRSPAISSKNNPAVKRIRSLRARKEREQAGLFYVDSVRLVAEAVQQGAGIETLVVAPELLDSPFGQKTLRLIQKINAPTLTVTPDVFAGLAFKEGGQGIGATVRPRWEPLERAGPMDGLCWIALDAVQFPGNLGTVLRTSDAVGGAGVLLLGHSADPYDPAAVRASMGAIFSQRLIRTTFAEFIAWKRRHNVVVIGTSPSAPMDYRAVSYACPVVLLMGSERSGLSPEFQAACDVTVRIPMAGRCDSLNLAVSASIVLYEMFTQHNRRE